MKKISLLIIAVFVLSTIATLGVASASVDFSANERGKPASPPGKPDPSDPEPDPDPVAPTGDRIALCIGISDYEGTDSDLSYCDDDAVDWKNYLQGEGFTVKLITDQQCTWTGIDAALDWLLGAEDSADDLVVITYSGHGYYAKEYRESCWVTQDLYGYWETELAPKLAQLDSQNVFFFDDACNQGTMDALALPGWYMAIGSTERSYTYDGTAEMANGIFTYFAMEAIALGYTTAEAIGGYAISAFNSATPGRAFSVDKYSGDLVIAA
jgi:hypothetical protein